MLDIDLSLFLRQWILYKTIFNDAEIANPNHYAIFEFKRDNSFLQYVKFGENLQLDGKSHTWLTGSSINLNGLLNTTIIIDSMEWEVHVLTENEMQLRSGGIKTFFKPTKIEAHG